MILDGCLRPIAATLVVLGLASIVCPALAGPRTVIETSVATTVNAGAGEPEQRAEHRRFWPRRAAWRQAARNALRDAGTWVPVGVAGVIAVGGWDREISDWAVRRTPIFGSADDAATWSDRLRAASDLGMIATALAGRADDHPWHLRLKTLLVEEGGAIAATSVTAIVKSATDRERPDGSDRESLPSGHASRAFAYAAASRRNLEAGRLGRGWRIGLTAGLETLAIGTGWARIEAQKHYPTDVLVGAALGNYVAVLVHDAFLGTSGNAFVSVNVDPRRPSVSFATSF